MATILTEEQVLEMLKSAEVELRQEVVEHAKRDIASSFSFVLNQEIRKVVEKYVQEEIAPDLAAMLVASKEGILKSATVAAGEIGQKLAQALIEEAAKNLAVSYKRSEMLKALFS